MKWNASALMKMMTNKITIKFNMLGALMKPSIGSDSNWKEFGHSIHIECEKGSSLMH